AMPQAIERLLATPRITPRLPCIKPEFKDIWLPIEVALVSQIPTSPKGRGISGPPHRSGGTPAIPAGTAPIQPRTALFMQARRAAGIVASIRRYIGRGVRVANWTSAQSRMEANDGVSRKCRSHDSGL